jgi:hypothetical protein
MRHEHSPPPLSNRLHLLPQAPCEIRGSVSYAASLPSITSLTQTGVQGHFGKEYSKLIRDKIASAEKPEVIYRINMRGPEFKAVVEATRRMEIVNNNLGARGISLGPIALFQA